MIDGLNDTDEQAAGLAELAARLAVARQPHPAQPDARVAMDGHADAPGSTASSAIAA